MSDETKQVAGGGRGTAGKVVRWRKVWLPGPEDINIDPDTGMAFISTQKRLHGRITPVGQGGIFGLDLRQEGMPLIELTRDLPDDHPFHPHGIGLYRDRGAVRLFAVNHTGDAETQIDVFAVEPRRLRLVASIPDDGLLTCPNDLVPIGPEQFYVTNVDTERSALLQQIDGLLGRAKGNVVYYSGDSGRFTVVAEGIACANGIAADPRRRRLYVAAATAKRLQIYPWDPAQPDRPLGPPENVELGTMPDNLEWDSRGDLWIGTHPSLIALTAYTVGAVDKAPSRVIRVHLPDGEPAEPPETIFEDDGAVLSASSVAAVDDGGSPRRLLIGAPWDDHILVCELAN